MGLRVTRVVVVVVVERGLCLFVLWVLTAFALFPIHSLGALILAEVAGFDYFFGRFVYLHSFVHWIF
jgi:hypothetical protein